MKRLGLIGRICAPSCCLDPWRRATQWLTESRCAKSQHWPTLSRPPGRVWPAPPRQSGALTRRYDAAGSAAGISVTWFGTYPGLKGTHGVRGRRRLRNTGLRRLHTLRHGGIRNSGRDMEPQQPGSCACPQPGRPAQAFRRRPASCSRTPPRLARDAGAVGGLDLDTDGVRRWRARPAERLRASTCHCHRRPRCAPGTGRGARPPATAGTDGIRGPRHPHWPVMLASYHAPAGVSWGQVKVQHAHGLLAWSTPPPARSLSGPTPTLPRSTIQTLTRSVPTGTRAGDGLEVKRGTTSCSVVVPNTGSTTPTADGSTSIQKSLSRSAQHDLMGRWRSATGPASDATRPVSLAASTPSGLARRSRWRPSTITTRLRLPLAATTLSSSQSSLCRRRLEASSTAPRSRGGFSRHSASEVSFSTSSVPASRSSACGY